MKRLNVSLSRTLLNQFDLYLFLWCIWTWPYTSKSFHTISSWASWTMWQQYPSVFCVSFTEIPDYVERAIFSMSKPNDSMVVLNPRNCCLAAKLKIVSILQSGPSPSFFIQLFFNTWVMESYHQLIMKVL